MLTGVAVHDDVLNNYDGIVDDQADGCGQTAQRHQVEALADRPKHQNGDSNRHRNHQPSDERRRPVAKEEEENDTGQNEPDEDGVAHAGD